MFKSKILGAVAIAAAIASGPAAAVGTGILFTVNEGVVPLALPKLVIADSIDYSYSATITQTLVGPAIDGNDPFTESGTFSASSFKVGSTTIPSQLNCSFDPFCYGIVGNFIGTGFSALVGGGIVATFNTFVLNLFLDVDQNGTGDIPLGTATQSGPGQAHVFPGLANGDFDVNLAFAPTTFGNTYFINPSPFTVKMETTGVTTTLSGVTAGAFVASADGSGNLFVNRVPEPGTLALFGLALSGLAMLRRRRNT